MSAAYVILSLILVFNVATIATCLTWSSAYKYVARAALQQLQKEKNEHGLDSAQRKEAILQRVERGLFLDGKKATRRHLKAVEELFG